MEEGWESCRKDGDAKRRRECLYVDNEGKEGKNDGGEKHGEDCKCVDGRLRQGRRLLQVCPHYVSL